MECHLIFFPVLPVTYLCLKRVHQEWRTTLKSVIVKSKCRLFTLLAIQFRRLFLLSLQPKPSISGKNVKILCSKQLKSLENRIFGIKLVLSNHKEKKSSSPWDLFLRTKLNTLTLTMIKHSQFWLLQPCVSQDTKISVVVTFQSSSPSSFDLLTRQAVFLYFSFLLLLLCAAHGCPHLALCKYPFSPFKLE